MRTCPASSGRNDFRGFGLAARRVFLSSARRAATRLSTVLLSILPDRASLGSLAHIAAAEGPAMRRAGRQRLRKRRVSRAGPAFTRWSRVPARRRCAAPNRESAACRWLGAASDRLRCLEPDADASTRACNRVVVLRRNAFPSPPLRPDFAHHAAIPRGQRRDQWVTGTLNTEGNGADGSVPSFSQGSRRANSFLTTS